MTTRGYVRRLAQFMRTTDIRLLPAAAILCTGCATSAPTSLRSVPRVINARAAANPYSVLSSIVSFDATPGDSARVVSVAPGDSSASPYAFVATNPTQIATLGLLANTAYKQIVEVEERAGRHGGRYDHIYDWRLALVRPAGHTAADARHVQRRVHSGVAYRVHRRYRARRRVRFARPRAVVPHVPRPYLVRDQTTTEQPPHAVSESHCRARNHHHQLDIGKRPFRRVPAKRRLAPVLSRAERFADGYAQCG